MFFFFKKVLDGDGHLFWECPFSPWFTRAEASQFFALTSQGRSSWPRLLTLAWLAPWFILSASGHFLLAIQLMLMRWLVLLLHFPRSGLMVAVMPLIIFDVEICRIWCVYPALRRLYVIIALGAMPKILIELMVLSTKSWWSWSCVLPEAQGAIR